MIPRVWSVTHNGRFKFTSITKDTVNGALDNIANYFFKEELVSIVVGVPDDPKAIDELRKFTEYAIKDGVSIIATDTTNGKIVGVCVNKILLKHEESIFEKFYKISKQESCLSFLDFTINADRQIDLFEHHKADCGVETMLTSVDSQYRQMSLGAHLISASMELIKQMSKGVNVKTGIDDQNLTLDHIPKFAYGMCTTYKTRNILRNLGFSSLHEVNYDTCFYKGQSYGSKIGHITKFYSMDSLEISEQ